MKSSLPDHATPLLRSIGIGLLLIFLAQNAAAQRTGVHASPGVMEGRWSNTFQSDFDEDTWPVWWSEPVATEDLDADGFEDLIFAEIGRWNQGRVSTWSAADGRLLWSVSSGGGYYASVAGHPDQNGDGKGDVLLGGDGRVQIRSGQNGSLLHTIPSGGNYDLFGASVSALDDVTGDGVAEILVGAPRINIGSNWWVGSALLYSGASPLAGPIMRMDGVNSNDQLGSVVVGAADLDGDGTPDFLAGAPLAGAGAGSIYAFSGDPANPGQIWRADGAAGEELGYSIQPIDDLDGDGIPEVVTESSILSGATGAVLRLVSEGFVVGDLDGDGVQDLVGDSGALFPGSTIFEAAVYSGMSGAPRFAVSLGSITDENGAVIGGPDLNGDGRHEVYSIVFPEAGDPLVFLEQVNPGMSLSASTVSLAAGGPLRVDLDFTPRAAFQEYRIVTSASGTGYLPVNLMLLLPLKYDLTVYQTYNGQYPAFATGMAGMLNAQGKGTGVLGFPAGLPSSLLGKTYTMAGMAGYPWGFWTATTFARSYTFVP